MLTEKQLEDRKQGLGGSDAAAIVGVGFKSAFDVWNEKINGAMVEPNEYMYWGNQIEPLIIKRYQKETGISIETTEETFYHDKHKFILGNIDGFNKSENILLECKVTRNSQAWGEPRSVEIPKYYLCQVAHYSSILKPKRVDIAVFFADQLKFEIYSYHPHQQLEKIILEKEVDFWLNHIVKKIPPKPQSFEESKQIWSVVQDKHIMATSEIAIKIEELKALKIQEKEINSKEDKLKMEIVEFMKDSEQLKDAYDNLLATRKIIKSNRFDTTGFKKENPALYKKYIQESEYERFMIK